MGLEWVFLVIGNTGSYPIIDWIVSYCRLDRIVSAGLDRIVLDGSGITGFYALAGYWLDEMDGLDGELLERGWDRRTLSPARTRVPPWAPEQERHHWLLRGGGRQEVVAGTNYVGSARAQSICVGEAK